PRRNPGRSPDQRRGAARRGRPLVLPADLGRGPRPVESHSPTMNTAATLPLAGRTALVTGASRGLGRRFAQVLAQAGADVAVTSRTTAALAGVCDEIAAAGRRAVPVALEVRDHASIQAAVTTAEAA